MYLSRIQLNPELRSTQQALQQPQLLHGAIESAFPGPKQRRLWRIDWLGQNCYLLVLSGQQGDFTSLARQFGLVSAPQPWQTRDYQPLLNRLEAGQTWQFRLVANPVISAREEGADLVQRGRVYAHVTQEQQKAWLLARAAKHGFDLQEAQFQVTASQWYQFAKQGKGRVSLRAVAFEGRLQVADAQLLSHALTEGIGRGKAYGCGLLTLAK